MLCYFYKCASVWYSVGVGKVTCMQWIFFPSRIIIEYCSGAKFWMGTVQNFISRLKMCIISFKQSLYKAHSSLQLKYMYKLSNGSHQRHKHKHEHKRLLHYQGWPWHKLKHKHKNIKTLILLVLMLMLMEWQFSLAHKLLVLISACLCLHCAKTHAYACAYTPSESQALIRDFISLHHL